MRMSVTRKQTKSAFLEELGVPKELPSSKLPTNRDVHLFYSLVRKEKKILKGGKDPPEGEVALTVAKKVREIWQKASIPTVSLERIGVLVKKHQKKVQLLNKSYGRDKNKESFSKKMEQLSLDQLFDVAACKCTDYSSGCRCGPQKAVPLSEREFLSDQRGPRCATIGGIDMKTTAQNLKRIQRKEKEILRLEAKKSQKNVTESDNQDVSASAPVDFASNSDETANNSAYLPPLWERPSTSGQSRIKVPKFSLACDRYGVSDRAAASLASSLLLDLQTEKNVKEDETSQLILTRNKIRRERRTSRNELINEAKESFPDFYGLYFDGRKDETKYMEKSANGKNHPRVRQEEHITLVQEPGSIYFDHVSPQCCNAETISKEIWDCLALKSVDLEKLTCIGSDGEPTNTGKNRGVIRNLENKLGRSLQWCICQLHSNELPLRHLLTTIDGKTSGPVGFTGEVGKALKDCDSMPVVAFSAIDSDSLANDICADDLSTDQLYLLHICRAVISGECSQDLAAMKPGKIHHARWLTTASRILRLYVATENPSEALKVLATFVVRVYTPMWFRIKSHHTIAYAPQNLWLTCVKTRYLQGSYLKTVQSVIQNNAYWAHPENLLTAMLADPDGEKRKMAAMRIKKCRSKQKYSKSVRVFHLPTLNFNADDYTDLISWDDNEITEPPVTKQISDAELDLIIQGDDAPLQNLNTLFSLPCHSQAVERIVKEVTIASREVYGHLSRDGFIRARLLHRQQMPQFELKSDFKAR